MGRVVNIVCKGPGHEKAPSGGWGLKNEIVHHDFDVLFDMHNIPQRLEKGEIRIGPTERMYRAAREKNVLFFSLEAWPGSPCSRYPIEEIKEYFQIDYFRSSLDYMIALAIYTGFKQINLWGVSLWVDDEWRHELPSASFWLGYAHAKGIKIKIMTKSALLKISKLYGYGTKPELTNNFIGDCPDTQAQ